MSLWPFSLPLLGNRALGSQAWQQSVASTLDTYLVIEDLSPGSPYQFRVSASNPWGISLPSEPSEFVRLPEYGESRPFPAPQAGEAWHPGGSPSHGCQLAVGMAGHHAGGTWICFSQVTFQRPEEKCDFNRLGAKVRSVTRVYLGPARVPGLPRVSPGTERGAGRSHESPGAICPFSYLGTPNLVSLGNPCQV